MKLILTDIDDTILKFADAFQDWAVQEKGYALNQSIRDGGSIQDAIGCHRDHVDELVIEFSTNPKFFSNIPPEEDALEIIPILHKMGYQFVACSSCVDGPEVTASRLKNLEDAFGIPWLDVHCTGLLMPKASYLKTYESAWWVEDNAGHALTGANIGHKSLLLNRRYNRLLEGKVKWYDSKKDFGFITPTEGGDVFIKPGALERSCLSTLTEGQVVTFDFASTDSGHVEATRIAPAGAVTRIENWEDVFYTVVNGDRDAAA